MSAGDNPKTSSGYGQIWDNLLPRWIKLKPDWEFYHIGWQNRDRPHKTAEGYTMLPINKLPYGFDVVLENLLKYNPDFFISMADCGLQGGFMEQVFEAKKRGWRGRWIAYTPFDTEVWEPRNWTTFLEGADINLAMADNGVELFNQQKIRNRGAIPLGVDPKIYRPLDNKEELRKRFNLTGNFVSGFVGRNQTRKQIYQLIRGFAQFSKEKNDVKLLLHTDKQPAEQFTGWDIDAIVAKFSSIDPDLFNKVIFTKANMDVLTRQGVQQEQMNEYFNLMDVFCYASGGEGFGLPGLECQSAGVPLMMTAYSTAFELTGSHGILIPVLKDEYGRRVTIAGPNGVENAVPNDGEIASLLDNLYKDWKGQKTRLTELSKKAREFALSYDWDIIAPRFIKLFEE